MSDERATFVGTNRDWARLRDAWLKTIARMGLPSRATQVASVIAINYLNRKTGEAWPSVLTIANQLGGVSVRTVQRALNVLVDARMLDRTLGAGHRTSRYRISASFISSWRESEAELGSKGHRRGDNPVTAEMSGLSPRTSERTPRGTTQRDNSIRAGADPNPNDASTRNLIDKIRSLAGIESPFSPPWSAEAVAAAIGHWRSLGHSDDGILWVIAEVRAMREDVEIYSPRYFDKPMDDFPKT